MRTTTTIGLLALAAAAGLAQADIVNIDSKAAIFDAGQAAPTLDGVLPTELILPAGTVGMTVPSVTGEVRAFPNLTWAGPDGNANTLNDTDINSFNGISGILAPTTLPLLGVFLSDSHTGSESAPSRLDYNALGYDSVSMSPGLGQTFFIGDGWNAASDLQNFVVPGGATRLYLGLADAGYFTGDPGAYADNEGSFTADVQFQTVPAPGALALLGMGGLIAGRRKRA